MTDNPGAVVGRLFCPNQPRGVLLLSTPLTAEDRRRIERHIEASVTAAREQCSRDHAREREIWQRAMTRTEAALVKARTQAFDQMCLHVADRQNAYIAGLGRACEILRDEAHGARPGGRYDGPWCDALAFARIAIETEMATLIRPASGADNPAAAQAANGVSPATGGVSDAESGTPRFFWLGRGEG